jgi:iron complex outermembrane receptor protein
MSRFQIKKLPLSMSLAMPAFCLLCNSAMAADVKTLVLPAVTVLPEVTVLGQADSSNASSGSAATRTGTSIEQVPQSVVVIERAVMVDQGSHTLSEVLRNVSNVTAIDQRDANLTAFKIRGFAAATILDGAPMPGTFPNQLSLAGVEQISVVKGPAGGLYGGSQGMNTPTLGGAIVITTAEPTRAPLRQVGLSLGNFGQKALSIDLNQPVNELLALRLSGEASSKDTDTERVYFRRSALAPSLLLTPNSDTKLALRLRDVRNETLDYPGLPRAVVTQSEVIAGVVRGRFIGADDLPPTSNNAQGANLQWNQRLSDQWDFALTLARNRVEVTQAGAFNASVIDVYLGMFGMPVALGKVVQDVYGYRMGQQFESTVLSPSLTGRFTTGEARHTVAAGLDQERSSEDAFMRWSDPLGVGLSPITSKINLAGSGQARWIEPAGNSMFDSAYVRRFKANTAYVQEQVQIGNWSLLGALRFNQLEIENRAGGKIITKSSTHTTPRLGAVFAFTPQVSAFAGYAQAVQTPYLTTFAKGVTPIAEETRQNEVGLRLKDWGGVTATLALFDLQRRNVATAAGAVNYLSDQGSQGVDVDLRYRVNATWQWLAAYTHQTAKYTTTNFAQVAAYMGQQLFNVPERQLRLATRYDAASGTWQGWGFGLGVTTQSELPGDARNSFFTPASTVLDAQVSYQSKQLRYGLAVSNLLDKQYLVPSAYFGGGQVTPATPRSVTASAIFSF